MTERRFRMSRRRLLIATAGLSMTSPVTGCGPLGGHATTLDGLVTELSNSLSPSQAYRMPNPDERASVTRGIRSLHTGGINAARAELATVGFRAELVPDAQSRRDYVVARSERGTERAWGMLILAASTPAPDILLEVPHPRADLGTEFLGLDLLRSLPRSALLIAGAHRRADSENADVAHNPESMFHQIAVEYSMRGAMQLQLHGFADSSLQHRDIVVSAGPGLASPPAQDIADALDNGFDVCRAWNGRCGEIEGRTNVQAIEAASRSSPFVHLEINRTTRASTHRQSDLKSSLIRVLRAL
ncbi:Secreted protein OS=Tsukamurella paurometabola (strain ATCC 8368 / DSM / CCUG 35730 / CIP 100753/ JCM 10117 / KCTC 9821 / NBRC 16120 / NCIMB 702349 / NCTC 13040) OX=521096 GN=Tpau_0308 PE=4 SV=1 [Tsukamurella paurometabola]|uniref:Secreted protein n=1 Tax=Tsukamurella paurometabola (strain ATCC 8368 / DSM 20162 / CCUG 35730 / CIP 100753 / JCM 10117 / KCTC 9821 / NBRC 16120 / NCIMB 702349 / NCTC 13040) TaxID=521096 RepID=D5URA1_TSUPD|nr:hypothetical protein Tpau_0308 [Tsukamurella paurometabola DSM 20162]SUP42315.1 Uncharacterised protein [Tsukamurella paurometabola]